MKELFEDMIQTVSVILAIAAVLLAFSMDARSAEKPVLPEELSGYEVEMGFEWFPAMPNHLFFVGSIVLSEPDTKSQKDVLLEFLERHPEIHTIVLHSGGGSVKYGAEMSRIIHERELTTYVPRDATCQSACGFMWLAGKVRILDGTLGAHQISVGEMGGTATTVGQMYAEVQSSMGNLMAWMYYYDVPVLYYAWMLLTPSSEMHVFTDEEEAELVTAEDHPYFDIVDDFVARKYTYLRALQEWRDSNVPTTNPTN